jgi:Putative zinc-finger
MMTTQSNETMANGHAELEGLVPGYVMGTLTSTESAALKRHLAECEICRSEIPHCEFLAGHLPSATETWKPSPAHFAKILAQVDKLDAVAEKPGTTRPAAATIDFFQRACSFLSQTPRPVRWTLALETFAFAALALFVMLPHGSNSTAGATYETLSNTETPATIQGLSVRLMFTEDMTTRELFELLKQAKAQIRQGPSAVGYYTVEVTTEDAKKSLTTLRAHPKVRLAQPVEPLSSSP